MPLETSESPVTPAAGSPLWRLGSSGWPSVAIMLVVAAAHPDVADWLVPGAILAAGLIWWSVRRTGPAAGVAPAAAVTSAGPETTEADQLAAVFEALEDPVLIVAGGEADDIAGRRIVLANGPARELLRTPREGGLLVTTVRDPGVLEAVDEALFGRVTRVVDYAPVGSRTRHWKALIRPLELTAPSPLALLVLRDETQVRRTELTRVDFLANASHELRTPLASLAGFIETLKGHAKEDPVARDRFLDIMAAQAERMSRLVADLMSLSRIELNEHVPPVGSVDLARAAVDVADAVGPLAKARGVKVEIERHAEPAVIDGDRDQIIQVIQNLVDNALKYTPDGARLCVKVRQDLTLAEAPGPRWEGAPRLSLVSPERTEGVRYAAISVRDHGPGMAREHLPRLTERFYRVEGQKSGDRSGTGLGLAIVKHIVNRHRGGLVVESVEGEGAVFAAYFPMSARR